MQLLGCLFGIKSFLQDLILRGNADRALSGVAMVAETGFCSQLLVSFSCVMPLIILEIRVMVTTHGHQYRLANRDRVGTQGERFGDVGVCVLPPLSCLPVREGSTGKLRTVL